MQIDEMHALVGEARIGRLATIDPDGRPNVVPFVYALASDTVHAVVDRKPKRTTALRRLENLRRDPRAVILVDHYSEDWEQLWWVRMRGTARVVDGGADLDRTCDLLRAKYEQYQDVEMDEIAILIDIEDWSGWKMR